MANSENHRLRPFFVATHRARLLLLVLLAAVFAGTNASAIWQMTHSADTVTGTISEVTESRQGVLAVSYTLTFRDDNGESRLMGLTNNGRVLNYLLAQEMLAGRRVSIWHSQGDVVAIAPLDATASTIRESRMQPAVKILIGLLALFILIFHIRPSLIERHTTSGGDSMDQRAEQE